MEKKKFKWPKFLTIKRMIIFGIIIIAGIILLSYFLGGYKEAKAEADLLPFTEEGFKQYDEYLKEEVAVVRAENEQYVAQVELLTKDNIDELLPTLIAEIKNEDNQKALKSQINELFERMPANVYTQLSESILIRPCPGDDDPEAYNALFDEKLALIDKDNYQTEIPKLMLEIHTVDNKNKLSNKLDDIKAGMEAVYAQYYVPANKGSYPTTEQYAKTLLDDFVLLYKNDNFAYYFNYRYTSFRLDQIVGGDETQILNSWNSIPQETKDPNSKGGKSTLYQQQSPLILKFLNRSGAIKQYNAYEFAISDTIGDVDNPTYVTPSFSIKEDHEAKSIQVYYDFRIKDIYYYYFPQNLYETRIVELIQNSKAKVQEMIDEYTAIKEEGKIKELQKYIDEHVKNTIVSNYFYNTKSTVGLEALLLLEDLVYLDIDATSYLDIIDLYHSDIDMLYKIVCMMIRVEYEADLDIKNPITQYWYHPRESIYLNQAYDQPTSQEPTVGENGETINNNYRTIGSYASMKKIFRDNLNQIFYTKCFYTKDDLDSDQKTFSVSVEPTDVTFKVAVEYKLTDNGVQCSIINNSIYESNPFYYPLFQIDILPYFTSVINEVKVDDKVYQTNGYMVIPDGSGAVISLNNGRTDYTQYSKRIYSTDLAYGYKVKQAETQDIMLPMYGLTVNRMQDEASNQFQNAYQVVVRASTGASQASINSQVSLFSDSYNKTYMSTTYRESQLVQIGTGYYAKEITKFTPDYVRVDTVINYYFMSSETKDFNYSDVAKFYQQILIDEGILSKENVDTTDDTVFNAEILGIYDYTTNFLGIVYSGHDTLTTLDQAVKIADDLRSWGVTDLNMIYRGWRKDGMINRTFNNMSFGSKLGNKTSYKKFIQYIKDNDITLYPVTSFVEINKYNEAYGKSRYSTRDVSSEYTVKYPYDLASNVYKKKATPIYTLSPRFFNTFAEKMATNYKKANPELDGMAFEKLGSAIVGDYKKRHIFYRFNSVAEQIKSFDTITSKGIENICLNSPYEYAVKYADNITNLTYESTLFEVFDYSIPLYQMVFSGYVDYSGLVINKYDEQGMTQHLMNIFKTGSNVHFIFTYDSSSELIQTEYNYYYYTQYNQWKSEVEQVMGELSKYQLHKYVLNYFEQYNNISNVYVSTYTNKQAALNNQATSDEFKVYLNYSDKAVNIINRNGETITVDRWNYYVDKEV